MEVKSILQQTLEKHARASSDAVDIHSLHRLWMIQVEELSEELRMAGISCLIQVYQALLHNIISFNFTALPSHIQLMLGLCEEYPMYTIATGVYIGGYLK